MAKITATMIENLRKQIHGRRVVDLGAGDLAQANWLAANGAAAVTAIDREWMPAPSSTRITTLQRHFSDVPTGVMHDAVAFLSWPVNIPAPGLTALLAAAGEIIYIGHTFDSNMCGTPALWRLLATRQILWHIPASTGSMICYGIVAPADRQLLPEEIAGLHQDTMSIQKFHDIYPETEAACP